jgi:hypothetical protein
MQKSKVDITEKHCKLGNHSTPVSDFGNSKKSRDGLHSSCRECQNASTRGYRLARNAIAVKRRNRDKFQIASFQAMHKAAKIGGQDNYNAFVSAICGSCDEAYNKLPQASIDKWLRFKGLA